MARAYPSAGALSPLRVVMVGFSPGCSFRAVSATLCTQDVQ
jgi:hypothetical protein